MVRLISEDLRVRGVPGLTGVRVVSGQSSVHTHQNGDTTEVESALTGGEFHGFSFHFGSDGGDMVELEVPVDMPCELKTVSGDISLEDLHGALNVRSVSGDIDGRSLTHVESATSTSGDLDLEQCFVDGDVITKSGDVDIDSCTVHGMLKSYSGDASALDTVLNDADVLSFSGDVHLEGVTIQGGARLKTTSGDIRVELDQHDVMVDVDTRSGEATVRGPGVDIETSRQRIPVGLATVELSVHTGSGDIEVRLDVVLLPKTLCPPPVVAAGGSHAGKTVTLSGSIGNRPASVTPSPGCSQIYCRYPERWRNRCWPTATI